MENDYSQSILLGIMEEAYQAETQEFFRLRLTDSTPDLYVHRGTQTPQPHFAENFSQTPNSSAQDVFTQTDESAKHISTQTDDNFGLTKRHEFMADILAEEYFERNQTLKEIFKRAFLAVTVRIANDVSKSYPMIPRRHQSTSNPGPANLSSGEEICRRYIWGTCNKHGQCIFRHELDIGKMKDILQFCHDYQNRNGCTRENCKYLHASKEEQNLFHATGQLPRVLADRHVAIASAATNMTQNAETIPQIAMFISESFMTQPPPAPWPPLPPPQAVMPQVATAPPPPPASPPRHAQAIPQTQQPPPPPVPTPTSTPSSVSQVRLVPTTYPAVPTQNLMFTMNQRPPIVPNFDASMPPPPIPSAHIANNNQHLKRKVAVNGVDGPNKLKKPEGPEVSEALCESCIQRELRIDGYKLQMETLHDEEESQILIYKKKLQEYELGREILKTLVGPDLFRLLDDLIEGAQTPHENVSSLNSSSSVISGSSTVPRQAVLQLFEMVFSGGPRNVIEPVPSTSRLDETLLSLTSLSRRRNVANYSNPAPSPDLIYQLIESLRNSIDRSADVRTTETPDMRIGNNGANGLITSTNGQKSSTSRYGVAGYSGPGVQSQDYGPRAQQPLPNYSVPGPSGYAGSAPATAPPPPAAYPMYHPAIPPPPRHYYAQAPVAPNASNMQYNGTDRAPAPTGPQGIHPPSSSAPRPSQPNAPMYNYVGRYPQQPYFPPYQ